jgi:hypothetical protein
MNKPIFFAAIAGLIAIIVFLLITIMVVQQRKIDLANPIPTEIPTPTPTIIFDIRPTAQPSGVEGAPLAVVSVSPTDGATNVPIDTNITITFNQKFTLDNFIFAMTPDVKYHLSYDLNKLQAYVITEENLQPNTVYTYKVNTLQQLSKTFSFTTGQATGAAGLKSGQ